MEGDFNNLFDFLFFIFSAPAGLGLILHVVIIIGNYPHKPSHAKVLPYFFSL